MSFLAFRERMELRRIVSQGIRSGQLPADAAIVLTNSDAFAALQDKIGSRYAAFSASGGSHPILAWLAANWQTILQDVLALLPLFGISVPPITLPPTTPPGGTPTAPGSAAMAAERVTVPRLETADVSAPHFHEESQVAGILFEAIRTARETIVGGDGWADCTALRAESIACCRKAVKALDALIDSLQISA